MSDINFTCIPFARVKEEILKGSSQSSAIHIALREALGDNYDLDYEYYRSNTVNSLPFEPERVMLAIDKERCFVVYTDCGRLLVAGRYKRFRNEEKDIYLPEGVSCFNTRCLSGRLMTMERLHLPHRVFLADGCFEELNASEIVCPDDGFRAYPGYVPDRAFAKSALTSMRVWDGVWSISKEAFRDCPNLKTVSLPSSLSYIGENAFSGCPKDLRIIFRGTREQWDAVKKQESEVRSEVHYDNSRVGYDYGAEYRTSGWIDFDTYTVECTEE